MITLVVSMLAFAVVGLSIGFVLTARDLEQFAKDFKHLERELDRHIREHHQDQASKHYLDRHRRRGDDIMSDGPL